MTLPRLIILTTEREKFRLANTDRVTMISEALKSRYNVVVAVELSEALITSLTADDILFVRSKEISLTERAMALKNKCRVLIENPYAILADDNKETFKVLCRKMGVDTPESHYDLSRLEYPVFVKPANLGDSIGVDSHSLCYSLQEVKAKCSELLEKHDSVPMVEPYLIGDEFTVAVLYNKGNCYTAPLHLTCTDVGLTYEVKQQDSETMARVLDVDNELDSLAKRIADSIRVARMCRIDFIRDYTGRCFALEINVFPGLGENGYMFQALRRDFGWDYEQFLTMAIGIN